MTTRRRGVTLIELAVTLIAASFILMGLSIVILSMLRDQKMVTVGREQAFGRVRGIGEITWTLKQASRRGIRQEETGPQAVREADDPNLLPKGVGQPSGAGVVIPGSAVPRGVITYVIDNYNQDEPVAADGTRSRTGIIYQANDTVYRYEVLMSQVSGGVPGWVNPANANDSNRSTSGFNGMNSGALAAWIANAANQAASEVLAVGVDRLDVNYVKEPLTARNPVNPYSIHWEIIFFKNG